MVLSILLRFIYPPPPSLFITAMTVINVASLANSGFNEIKGKNIPYSKFWNLNNNVATSQIKLSGRTGMLLAYTPAFLAGVISFGLFPDEGLRFTLVSTALAIHFFKRLFEVIFIHKYSSSMPVDVAIVISLSYFLYTVSMIYAQYLTGTFPEPPMDLKYAGVVMFLVGISGNFYHHYLLSKLRKEGEKEYKIPRGGLFDLVVCPHYLFEILGFTGVACISQTVYAFSFTMGSALVLMGRSYATKKWYLSKFDDFPKDVKALIPYIF